MFLELKMENIKLVKHEMKVKDKNNKFTQIQTHTYTHPEENQVVSAPELR